MSHVTRKSYVETNAFVSEDQRTKALKDRKWKTVEIAISKADFDENFKFLNDAVVLRSGREGLPLMTTTGIFGPIRPNTKVALIPGEGTGVVVEAENYSGKSLIDELTELRNTTSAPTGTNASVIYAKWISAVDGGGIPNLDSSSNVFGSTGSLLINQLEVDLPVMDHQHPDYAKTLAYYGAKLLQPKESFFLGFDQLVFGMEYNTFLPDYIRSYAMEPFGGGGLFVEHHPFPHIWQPKPDKDGQVFCESKITLGREIVGPDELKEKPRYHFTTFRVPADGSALAVNANTIHNDSYSNGPQIVFLANTPADTVALRETSPFKNVLLKDLED